MIIKYQPILDYSVSEHGGKVSRRPYKVKPAFVCQGHATKISFFYSDVLFLFHCLASRNNPPLSRHRLWCANRHASSQRNAQGPLVTSPGVFSSRFPWKSAWQQHRLFPERLHTRGVARFRPGGCAHTHTHTSETQTFRWRGETEARTEQAQQQQQKKWQEVSWIQGKRSQEAWERHGNRQCHVHCNRRGTEHARAIGTGAGTVNNNK